MDEYEQVMGVSDEGRTPKERAALAGAKLDARRAIADIRAVVLPEDD